MDGRESWWKEIEETKKPQKLVAGVCSGLIMGSVDHIQHRTMALISAMSHLFFFRSLCSSVCIHCYRAHDLLSLMDICHASDSVPKRFRRQRSSFKTSGTRRMQLPGISGRQPLFPPTTYPLTPSHPALARPHISVVKPIVEIWQQLLCSPDGFQP